MLKPPPLLLDHRTSELRRRRPAGQRGSVGQGLLLFVAVLALGALAGWWALSVASDEVQRAPSALPADELAALGDGFVVWESRRSGDWRIWRRGFDGGPPTQLTHERSDRQHCCAHLSPDGRRLAYLSLAKGEEIYPEDVADGELRLLDLESGEERTLVPTAQTYYEHRAAVWKDDASLIYIGGDGRTRLLDLASGESKLLTARAQLHQRHGWLIDPTLSYAITGLKTSFSPYDRERRAIVEEPAFGGCQGYFSHDGRWGFWAGGAGGPLSAIDLATRRVVTVVEKSDARLPADRGYLYFPNLSTDGMLFTFAASNDEHHHFEGDYDVFVARVDPLSFELLGRPVRLTDDPGTDRFPDVYHAPLELGRAGGEAPLSVDLGAAVADPAGWSWSWGDDGPARAPGRHVYAEPGVYEVRARRGDEELRGQVLVQPAAPPRVLEARQVGAAKLELRFDEAIDAAAAELRFASGRKIGRWVAGDDGLTLTIELAAPLDAADRLIVEGVTDRAQRPNRMPRSEVEIAAPRWPSDRRGLVFLWRDGDSPNRIVDPTTGEEASCLLEYRGVAWLDHDYAMVLRDGAFVAADGDAARVVFNCKKTNQLSFEMALAPHFASAREPGRVVSLAGEGRIAFIVEQRGRKIFLRLRTAHNEAGPGDAFELAELPARRPSHLAVAYEPGRLRAWVDGEAALDTGALQGGFFNWKYRPLTFGSGADGGDPWAGTLESVAIYNRLLDAAEVAENHRRLAAERAEREAVPRLRVKARLEAVSEAPTLEQISPYREALVVYDYRVLEVVGGRFDGGRLRVAHPAILDRQRLPILERRPGSVHQLLLEPFGDNPQVESWFVSDTLDEDFSIPLFYDVGR